MTRGKNRGHSDCLGYREPETAFRCLFAILPSFGGPGLAHRVGQRRWGRRRYDFDKQLPSLTQMSTNMDRGSRRRPHTQASRDPALLRRLLRAKDRIDAASHEEWPVERLASVSGVSRAHFARCFKDAFGVPPHRYLLSRRIERAKALLRDTDKPILDIALETGCLSLGTFGRMFRDTTGERPTELRTRERASVHALHNVPHCFVSAAHRPDLKTAVSEKRRREAAHKMPPHTDNDV